MLNIQILGPSCANCLKLEVLVMETLEQLGVRDALVDKVADEREIVKHLLGDPPGLIVNDQLVWSGGKELPKKSQILGWIGEVLETRATTN